MSMDMKSAGSPADTRRYRQTARAEKAARTAQRILDACLELASTTPLTSITLTKIAETADVSVQTVMRRFGSRDGVVAAAVEHFQVSVTDQRRVTPGNIDEAVRVVVEHYEEYGDIVIGLLAQENEDAQVTAITQQGRELHDRWVSDSFAPAGPVIHRLLVVATDVYTWKLLRCDRGLTATHTEEHMRRLCHAILADASNTEEN